MTKTATVMRTGTQVLVVISLLWCVRTVSANATGIDEAAYSEAIGSCDASAIEVCFGLELWISLRDGVPVQTTEWVGAQVGRANHFFAEIGVGFELAAIHPLEEGEVVIETRDDRDRLGHDRWTRGVIHVFVVGQLDNVDEEGVINGVHWRDRADTSHRWIIVAATAWHMTFVHELGHYFGLPHSDYHVSMMNKTSRAIAPGELTFHPDEFARMRRMVERRLEQGRLQNRIAE